MGQRLRDELRRIRDRGGPGADDAEAALGDAPIAERLSSSIRALARHRGASSSICPSDAARAVGGDGWRDVMTQAREAARALARSGQVEITQRGNVLDPDGEWRGPVRIRIVER